MTPPHPDAARAELVAEVAALRGKVVGILFRRKLMKNYVKDENVPLAFKEIDDALLAFVQQREGALREMLESLEFDTSSPSDEMDCPMCEENERQIVKWFTPHPDRSA